MPSKFFTSSRSHNSDKSSVTARDTEVSRENTRTYSHLSRARSKPNDHTSTTWPYFTSPASAFGSRELPQTDHPVTDDELIQSQLDRLHLQPVFFRRKYSKSPKPSRSRPPGSNSKLKTSTHSCSTEPVFAVATV
ncbi:hypothetical protein CSKR_201501 [Clonorchis sinensis]|uniref:Uncharacterized protein n=1 Tax=Clonorchis sinensis TaxID=79923 RepID=A0A8T1MRC8_CLOSI|nr:hypothetical protein CSKR_201501 [Clonorchis sinensis]